MQNIFDGIKMAPRVNKIGNIDLSNIKPEADLAPGYKDYVAAPTTKEEWIKTLDTWWDPELKDIINKYGQSEFLTEAIRLYDAKEYPNLAGLLHVVWADAPDDSSIHLNPGWEVLCDLCSESYLIEN